ncbi:MAG TPA: hypothetical protein VIL36_24630 [Acidimicrobiales bacterium]
MSTLLHVWADGDAPRVADHPAVVGTRTYERVADYAYAGPVGRRWLTLHDLRPGTDATDVVPAGDDVGPVTVFEQISPANGGWLTADGPTAEGELPVGKAVLSVVMDVAEAGLDVFHGWYDEEHLPKLVAVPGIDAARRFRAVGGDLAVPGRHRFLALYEFSGLDVLDTPAWAEAAQMTPRTELVVPHVEINSQICTR